MNLQHSKSKKKKGFASGFCTCDRRNYPLDIGLFDRTRKSNHRLTVSEDTGSRKLAESPLFGRVSEPLGNIGYPERNYSGRSLYQLKVSIYVHPSLCPRSHLCPSCLAYFLFRLLIFYAISLQPQFVFAELYQRLEMTIVVKAVGWLPRPALVKCLLLTLAFSSGLTTLGSCILSGIVNGRIWFHIRASFSISL